MRTHKASKPAGKRSRVTETPQVHIGIDKSLLRRILSQAKVAQHRKRVSNGPVLEFPYEFLKRRVVSGNGCCHQRVIVVHSVH